MQQRLCAEGDCGAEMWRDSEGEYVLHADHAAEVARLQDECKESAEEVQRVLKLLWDETAKLAAAQQENRTLREVERAARSLVHGMETCHECKGTVLVEEQPTHCEDCSQDCDYHEGAECPTLYGLHLELKRKLAALAPQQPQEKQPCPHERLNEDGMCRQCGNDRRGI